jgi:predicted cobalt transporter CbtA
MMGNLLLRGMIAGVVAAVIATLFARVFAEPQVDLAIAFEAAHEHAAHAMVMAPEPELVSRAVQKGFGLLTAMALYGAAIGGFFALVFAATYGRSSVTGPRTLALLLAIAGFLAIALVPGIKYPPTPPAVGQHETVALRTIAYFTMAGFSIISLLLAARMRLLLARRIGAVNAALAATGIFVAAVSALQLALPVINEVPHDFPAVVLWDFRVASLATQAVLWTAIGTIFGGLAEARLRRG